MQELSAQGRHALEPVPEESDQLEADLVTVGSWEDQHTDFAFKIIHPHPSKLRLSPTSPTLPPDAMSITIHDVVHSDSVGSLGNVSLEPNKLRGSSTALLTDLGRRSWADLQDKWVIYEHGDLQYCFRHFGARQTKVYLDLPTKMLKEGALCLNHSESARCVMLRSIEEKEAAAVMMQAGLVRLAQEGEGAIVHLTMAGCKDIRVVVPVAQVTPVVRIRHEIPRLERCSLDVVLELEVPVSHCLNTSFLKLSS